MEKEFIPYEQALALKELGFDEPCLGYYIELRNPQEGILTIEKCENNFDGLLTPTFSQAFRFFREKYGVHSSPRKYDETQWWVEWGTWTSSVFRTFEEAELAWLRKLIEIVKR
jgi:hypothetical protein